MSYLAFQQGFLHGIYFTLDELSVTTIDVVEEWAYWILWVMLPNCFVADIFPKLSTHLFNNYELIFFNIVITVGNGSINQFVMR